MSTAPEVDALGFTRCGHCGTRFKHNHSCRRARAALVTRRPPGFAELVEQARAEARAAAAEQLALDELRPPCSSCGGVDADLDEEGVCIPCIARQALLAAGVLEVGPVAPGGRPPP